MSSLISGIKIYTVLQILLWYSCRFLSGFHSKLFPFKDMTTMCAVQDLEYIVPHSQNIHIDY